MDHQHPFFASSPLLSTIFVHDLSFGPWNLEPVFSITSFVFVEGRRQIPGHTGRKSLRSTILGAKNPRYHIAAAGRANSTSQERTANLKRELGPPKNNHHHNNNSRHTPSLTAFPPSESSISKSPLFYPPFGHSTLLAKSKAYISTRSSGPPLCHHRIYGRHSERASQIQLSMSMSFIALCPGPQKNENLFHYQLTNSSVDRISQRSQVDRFSQNSSGSESKALVCFFGKT